MHANKTQSTRVKRALVICVIGLATTAEAIPFIDKAHQPIAQVREICSTVASAVGTQADSDTLRGASLDTLVTWTNKHMRRPAKAERMESRSLVFYRRLYEKMTPAQRARIFADIASLGDTQEVFPARQHYDYIVIHGTTVTGMRERVISVARAVQTGRLQLDKSTQIVFLDGERPLFQDETAEVLCDPSPHPRSALWHIPEHLPQDERGAAEWVWQQLELPKAMRTANMLFIHAPKRPTARRAETEDTVAHWVKQHRPKSGSVLMVSENPFIEYQRLVTLTMLHKAGRDDLPLDVMGPNVRLAGVPDVVRLGVLLDNVSACLMWTQRLLQMGVSPARGP